MVKKEPIDVRRLGIDVKHRRIGPDAMCLSHSIQTGFHLRRQSNIPESSNHCKLTTSITR
jgi:hypothetical protein